jgi:hypothetical protein
MEAAPKATPLRAIPAVIDEVGRLILISIEHLQALNGGERPSPIFCTSDITSSHWSWRSDSSKSLH